MRRWLREHAALLVLLVAGSIVAAIVYELTGGGKPYASVREHPRLNFLDTLNEKRPRALWTDDDFECLGWRATHDCDPLGQRDRTRDRACDVHPQSSLSGYCEVRNRTSGETFRVMLSTCSAWRWWLVKNLTCNDARRFTDYSILAAQYNHTETTKSFAGKKTAMVLPPNHEQLSFRRGIAMIAYPKVIAGVYAIVRVLRHHGCALPVELWIDPLEMRTSHTLLQELVKHHNVLVRVITDPSATKFHTKPYALYHSAFDSVLFLDSDNIPAKDPTYLFDSAEFVQHGALFWPDFWRPTPTTPFNVHEQNVMWQLLDMPFTDMFEGESGQLLVDRTRSRRALEKLMFYSSHAPKLLNEWELVYGDKDLFRLAWLNTSTPFFFIPHLVALGGKYDPDEDFFCGVSMVQRDASGDILFLHRNQAKLDGRRTQQVVITHLQKFIGGNGGVTSLKTELDKYRVRCLIARLGQHNCFFLNSKTPSGEPTPMLIQSLAGTQYPLSEQLAIQFSIEGRHLLTPAEESEIAAIEKKQDAANAKEADDVLRKRRQSARNDLVWRLLLVLGVGAGVAVYTKPQRIWRRYRRLRAARTRGVSSSSSPASAVSISVASTAVDASWRRKKSVAFAGEDPHIL